MTALTIVVHGTPAPQGSKRHLGKGVMVESSKRVKPWRQDVKYAALKACGDEYETLIGAVALTVMFYMPRPKGHYRTGRYAGELRAGAPDYPAGKPDLDKLVRSTMDAIGEAGVWRDDAQVVTVLCEKHYAGPGPVGARINVEGISPVGAAW